MSFKVLVDLSDPSGSCQSLNSSNTGDNIESSFKRSDHFVHNYIDRLVSLCRMVYFRRLKLLKFYLAMLVIILLLFLLLMRNPSEGNAQVSADGLKINIHPIDPRTSAQIPQSKSNERVSKVEQISTINVKSSYPNNLTYALTARDFLLMKDINVMQVRVREAMKHSWDNYRRYAWGYDMLKPRSKEADHWFDLGLTIVDSVDTLIIMGLSHDTNLAIDWMENELKFTTNNENSNCFEITIRILAGILSAYHLTGSERLKQQAIELGDVLLHCYGTESKLVPYSDIDLRNHRGHPPQWNPYSSLSEVTSLQLEFRYLSQISGNPIYEETTFLTSQHIHNLTINRRDKLLPMYIDPNNGQLEDSVITLGARADSYYEYLLKQYLQTGIKWLEDDYLNSMDEVATKLVRHTRGQKNFTYVANMQIFRTLNDTEDIKYYDKMDHLVCFLPGTLALGFYHFSPQASDYRLKYNLETPSNKLNSRYDNHLDLAKALARTCYHMYSEMGTGLAPEIATFVRNEILTNHETSNQPELQAQSDSAHNILRPEFVESLFYLYHITGLPVYRDQATRVFESFEKYSRIPTGYSAISDVRPSPSPGANLDELLHKYAPDRMESFWMSETLKYLYLIYCDDQHVIGTLLNRYVFNTEAHMLPIL